MTSGRKIDLIADFERQQERERNRILRECAEAAAKERVARQEDRWVCLTGVLLAGSVTAGCAVAFARHGVGGILTVLRIPASMIGMLVLFALCDYLKTSIEGRRYRRKCGIDE